MVATKDWSSCEILVTVELFETVLALREFSRPSGALDRNVVVKSREAWQLLGCQAPSDSSVSKSRDLGMSFASHLVLSSQMGG